MPLCSGHSICQMPVAPDGLRASDRPPDSTMPTAAMRTAHVCEPPALGQSCSSWLNEYVVTGSGYLPRGSRNTSTIAAMVISVTTILYALARRVSGSALALPEH